MREWISVKDRLPELPDYDYCSRIVIACDSKNFVSPMIYCRTLIRGKPINRWKHYWGKIADVQVTHWMPLPEPPEEERNEQH